MQPTDDHLYRIHLHHASLRGVPPLDYAEFCSRLKNQSETDLAQLLVPTQSSAPGFVVKVQVKPAPEAKFRLGRVSITPAAARTLLAEDVFAGLSRHVRGEWGLLTPRDCLRNVAALADQGRVVSVYRARNGCRFYVVTEPGWRVTTVLLALEI